MRLEQACHRHGVAIARREMSSDIGAGFGIRQTREIWDSPRVPSLFVVKGAIMRARRIPSNGRQRLPARSASWTDTSGPSPRIEMQRVAAMSLPHHRWIVTAFHNSRRDSGIRPNLRFDYGKHRNPCIRVSSVRGSLASNGQGHRGH